MPSCRKSSPSRYRIVGIDLDLTPLLVSEASRVQPPLQHTPLATCLSTSCVDGRGSSLIPTVWNKEFTEPVQDYMSRTNLSVNAICRAFSGYATMGQYSFTSLISTWTLISEEFNGGIVGHCSPSLLSSNVENELPGDDQCWDDIRPHIQ